MLRRIVFFFKDIIRSSKDYRLRAYVCDPNHAWRIKKHINCCSIILILSSILTARWVASFKSSAQYEEKIIALETKTERGTDKYFSNYSEKHTYTSYHSGQNSSTELPFEFGIQFYNHKHNIRELARRYKLLSIKSKIIKFHILEDGSSDGSKDLWLKYMCCNWAITHTNNLHEIRSYDKAIQYSTAPYFITLQDDDLPPTQHSWILDLHKLFRLDNKLAMIGMWCGFTGTSYFANIKGSCRPKRKSASISTKSSGIPFTYVSGINQGPIAIRTDVYRSLGGFNFSYSEVGKPGIHFETELSLRMWESGWRVGLINSLGWSRGVGGKGTASSLAKWLERKRANRRNLVLVKQRFPNAALKVIDKEVRTANKELTKFG